MKEILKRKYIAMLRRLLRRLSPGWLLVPDIYGRSSHKQRDMRDDPGFMTLARPAVTSGKTTLYYDRLFNLYQVLKTVAGNRGNRDCLRLMEVGVFKGGGSDFIGKCARKFWSEKIEMYAVDTFEGHAGKDVLAQEDAEHRTGTFIETSFEKVQEMLAPLGFVNVVKGRIQDVYGAAARGQWDFIHLDVDIKLPTEFMLERAKMDLAPGGAIVVDDYDFLSCPGIKEVVDAFCRENPDFFGINLNTGQFVLIRIQ